MCIGHKFQVDGFSYQEIEVDYVFIVFFTLMGTLIVTSLLKLLLSTEEID